MPNIFGEFVLAAVRFAAMWIIFYNLHHPRTKLRRILAIVIMVLFYPIHRILFFVSGGNVAVNIVFDIVLFLNLVCICEAEPSPESAHKGGDLIQPLISALYFYGMFQLINYILMCYMYFSGTIPPSFSFWSYFWKTVEGILILIWSLFYYRIAREKTAQAPLLFSLLTIFTPIAGVVVILASINATKPLLDYGVNVFLYAGLFGTLIIVLNMCIFYLYTKLSVSHEALIFAGKLAHTPPVWTPEQGLSAAFIEKYEITPRERDVIDTVLQGKTDKEISIALNIAVNTVQAHLKNIYRKTGAAGRFALSALIQGASKEKHSSIPKKAN